MNHMLTVRTDLLKNDPAAVRGLYQALTASIDDVRADGPQTSRQRAVTYGLDEDLLSPLRVAIRYAREQELIRADITAEDIFSDFTRFIGPHA